MESIRNLIKKNKKVVIALIALGALFVVYRSFFVQDEVPDLVTESRSIRDLEVGQEIISTLNRLKTITIDPEVLDDGLFRRLVDFSQPLPDYPVSKRNPFVQQIPGQNQTSSADTQEQENTPDQQNVDTAPTQTQEDESFDASNTN